MLVLIAAVVGGVILSQRNQETRRGAAASESGFSILPQTVTVSPNREGGWQLWVNPGKSSDKVVGAELFLSYDKSVLKYIKFVGDNGFESLTDNIDNGNGELSIRVVVLSAGKTGAVSVGKVYFEGIAGGESDVTYLSKSKLIVTGQSTMWTPVASRVSGAKINVYVAEPTSSEIVCRWCGNNCVNTNGKGGSVTCPGTAPPTGQSCVKKDNSCVIETDANQPSMTFDVLTDPPGITSTSCSQDTDCASLGSNYGCLVDAHKCVKSATILNIACTPTSNNCPNPYTCGPSHYCMYSYIWRR